MAGVLRGYSGLTSGFVDSLQKAKDKPWFLTMLIVSIVLSLIIVTTSSIGIKEYEDLPTDEKLQHSSGYTAQVVFLVLAILIVLLMFAFMGIAYYKAPGTGSAASVMA